MSDPIKAPLVPGITSNPMLDAVIRHGITAVSSAAATAAVVWMDAHGFNPAGLSHDGISISALIFLTVTGVLSAAASAAWSWIKTHQSQNAIINGIVTAAITGQVPASVMAKATPDQAQAVEASPTATVR